MDKPAKRMDKYLALKTQAGRRFQLIVRPVGNISLVFLLYQFGIHGDAGVKQFGDGAVGARIFRHFRKFRRIKAGYARSYFQVDIGNSTCFKRHDRFGIDARGREACAGNDNVVFQFVCSFHIQMIELQNSGMRAPQACTNATKSSLAICFRFFAFRANAAGVVPLYFLKSLLKCA